MEVHVQAPLRPTEDPEKVEQAVTRFMGEAEVVRHDDRVAAFGHSLEVLRQRVWELRIIDTFRGQLLARADGDELRFIISKQAAYAGRVSIPPAPHALGDIAWVVRVGKEDPFADAEALAWWLCPETRDGQVVGA